MINGLCESLIRKMDDSKAKKVLEEIRFNVREDEIKVLNQICWQIAYDRDTCKTYGINYGEIYNNMNKVRLASYYEYVKALDLFEVTGRHKKNIIIVERNGVQRAVVRAA